MSNLNEIIELIKEKNNEELKTKIDSDNSLAKAKTPQGISLLMFAFYCRNKSAAEILRSYQENIDLFEAVGLGDIETVETYLQQQPESINSFANDGFTALGLASFFGHAELVKLLLEKGADPNIVANNLFMVTPLHSASAISNYEITETLLNSGANPNAKQMNGVTPLHSAAHHGQSELAKLLIKQGAEVNAETVDGKTPLFMAQENGNEETIEVLMNHGAQ